MPSPAEPAATGSRPACLVTGATGAVGPAVVAALAQTHDVRTLSRRVPDPSAFSVPITAVTGNVSDPDTVRRAARGVDIVVHLAALLHVVDPAESMRAEYERVNVGGTAAVLEAARAENVSRVVVMSSVAVYGHDLRLPCDEESPAAPTTFYGETKAAAERLALRAQRADGRPLATVLRSAAVYGPRVKGNYERLIHALARRRFVPIGHGDNRRTVVFEDDLAAATSLAAVHPRAAGRVYNVSDGTPHPLRDIIAAICDALEREPPRWRVPVACARAAVRVAGLFDSRLPRMLDRYLEEVAVDADRIQVELGFRPAVTLIDGWRATVAELRRRGRL